MWLLKMLIYIFEVDIFSFRIDVKEATGDAHCLQDKGLQAMSPPTSKGFVLCSAQNLGHYRMHIAECGLGDSMPIQGLFNIWKACVFFTTQNFVGSWRTASSSKQCMCHRLFPSHHCQFLMSDAAFWVALGRLSPAHLFWAWGCC